MLLSQGHEANNPRGTINVLIEINASVGKLSEGSLLLELSSLLGVLYRKSISRPQEKPGVYRDR